MTLCGLIAFKPDVPALAELKATKVRVWEESMDEQYLEG